MYIIHSNYFHLLPILTSLLPLPISLFFPTNSFPTLTFLLVYFLLWLAWNYPLEPGGPTKGTQLKTMTPLQAEPVSSQQFGREGEGLVKLVLCRSSAGNCCWGEFMITMTRSCPEERISQHFSPFFLLWHSSSVFFLWCFTSCKRVLYVLFKHSLILSSLSSHTFLQPLPFIHCQERPFWIRLRGAISCGYPHICLEDILVLCPFN